MASDGKLLTTLCLPVAKNFFRRYFLASQMGTFGKNLRRIRTDRGLASKELAKQVGVTPSMVSRWERKGVVPGTLTTQRVAKALGVSVDELVPESSSDLPSHTRTAPSSPNDRPQTKDGPVDASRAQTRALQEQLDHARDELQAIKTAINRLVDDLSHRPKPVRIKRS